MRRIVAVCLILVFTLRAAAQPYGDWNGDRAVESA